MPKQTVATPEVMAEPAQSDVIVSTGGAANQQTLRNIRLIIGREYKNRVQQRSFLISTIIIMVLLIIVTCIPTLIQFISAKSSSPTTLTVVDNAGPIAILSGDSLAGYINSNLNGSASQTAGTTSGKAHFAISTSADDVNSLKQKVKNGGISILLVLDRGSNQNLQFTYYNTTSASNDSNLSQMQALAGQLSFLDRAAHLGLTPAQTSSLFLPPDFHTVNTQPNQDTRSAEDRLTGFFIAYAGVLLIFMSVFLYGVGVATGVAEEKGTRIMEILVNAATPFQLMVGKIIGIGAAGLTQMVCLVTVGIGALLVQTPLQNALLGTTANAGLSINITTVSITLLLLVLVYFILGFLLYATLFAAVGALVKRQDEVQNASQPITWLFMIGYIISAAAGATSADATWMKVISYIPFWTPTVMLTRIGAGSVAWWEIPLSIVIMLVAIVICAILSARVYRFGVLMYGQKPKLGQLFKIIRTN